MFTKYRHICRRAAVSIVIVTPILAANPASANKYVDECNKLAAPSIDLKSYDHYTRGRTNLVCSRAVQIKPNDAQLAYLLGRVQAEFDSFRAAEPQLIKAAELGNATAYFALAQGYRAQKWREDYESRSEAMALTAAKMGNAQAQYYYAQRLDDKAPNSQEANKWYEKAAENGDTNAQYLLGTRLLNGRNMSANPELGLYWIKQSAQAGPDDTSLAFGGKLKARFLLSYLQERENLGLTKSSTYIALLEDAAKLGNVEAMYQLGILYWNGTGVAQDKKKAYDWFFKIDRFENHGKALFAMGVYQYEVKKQLDWASSLFARAAKLDPDLREQALELSAVAAKQAGNERERRNRENIRNNYYAAQGRKPPPENPQLTILIALLALGLVLDGTGSGGDMVDMSPPRYDPCSNPWYAEASPFC